MHQVILLQRRVAATQRIVERATALAEHLELDPELIQGLHPSGAIKEAPVADMIRLEGVANILDQIAEKVGVPAAAVTDVTVTKFRAPAEEEAVPANQIQVGQAGAQMETLPDPVLEEEVEAPAKAARRPAGRPGTKKK